MGMLQGRNPPQLPQAPKEYDKSYMSQLLNILTIYFTQQNAVQMINVAGINIDIGTLPTTTDLATLRSGDVYLETTAGATLNCLKVKP